MKTKNPDPHPDPDPNPNPDPLVRGMDQWIRIRIHTKMSRIRNTGFSLGRCRNFAGSESGQKQSVKLLKNMVYNTTPSPPPHSYTLSECLYIIYFGKGGRGGGGQREGRGATVHKRGRKYQQALLYLQSINFIKHQ